MWVEILCQVFVSPTIKFPFCKLRISALKYSVKFYELYIVVKLPKKSVQVIVHEREIEKERECVLVNERGKSSPRNSKNSAKLNVIFMCVWV